LCAFSPSYGHGMTHACRHARLLNQIFNENDNELKDISHIFNSRASKISDECWIISTGNDWKTPTLKIIKTDRNGQTKTYHQARPSLISQFIRWYNYWFIQCTSKSRQLSTDFLQVMSQHKSQNLLMKPTTFLTVCYTALIHYFYLSKK